ncbi:MAG: hypothetical protein KJ630_22725 [Proteobacteria bacterium]|nr:hypothetical protein [Pseudomonadota bacterium]
MKKTITVLAIFLCMASASPVLARGFYNNNHSDNYHGRSNHYYGHHNGGSNNGLEIAAGVIGGLLLGSALVAAVTPPPRTVSYGFPEISYQQQAVVQRPKICVEERIVQGEWQVSRYNGRQVWVSFPYPVTQSVQVPCY